MKHIFRQTLLGAAVILACSASQGMNLLQAYQAAVDQDASIRASRAALDSGRERLPQARSQLLPSVSASVGRNNNNLATTAPNLLGSLRDTYFSFNKTVALRQPIFNLQRVYQYQQSQDQVAESEATYDKDLQSLSVRVGGAYLEALLSAEQLRLVRAQKAQYTAMVDAARKSFAAGTGTRTDIDDAQARLDMAIASELEAMQNEDYTRRQLEILVNQSVTSIDQLNVNGLRALPSVSTTLAEWIDEAMRNSPEIKALEARLEASDMEIAKAKAAHAPTLDGVLQWSDSGSENITRINARYENKVMGVQLNVPLFQGGYVNSVVRQAVAEKTRTQEGLEALRRDLNLRVHKEYRGVTEGLLRMKALEQAVRSAELLLDSTLKSQRAGVRTRLDVLNAEQQLATATRDLVQSRYLYLMSRLRLNSLVGKEALATITELNQAFQP